MSSLTLTLLRFAFLVGLWFFVALAISVMRRDLLEQRALSRTIAPAYRMPTVSRKERRAAARAERELPRKVVIVRGNGSGRGWELGQAVITLGRAEDCSIVLDDEYCSNRHARLVPRADGRWLIEDTGSTNGTYLNERKITGPTVAGLGERIRVGRTEIELRR